LNDHVTDNVNCLVAAKDDNNIAAVQNFWN